MSPLRFHLLMAAVFAIGLLCIGGARAHDQYHDWKIPGTTASCCNDQDCAPRRARMSDDGDQWEVRYEGKWLPVPHHAVLQMASPDGRSHACIIGYTVLCFVPGEVRS